MWRGAERSTIKSSRLQHPCQVRCNPRTSFIPLFRYFLLKYLLSLFRRKSWNGSHSLLTASLSDDISSHLETIRNIDWASTPLGPMEQWPDDLTHMFTFLIHDNRPTALYWGEEKIVLYNSSHIPLVGKKHPDMLGKSLPQVWPEVKDILQVAMDTARYSGQAYVEEDAQFFLQRNGYNEECYFTWSRFP